MDDETLRLAATSHAAMARDITEDETIQLPTSGRNPRSTRNLRRRFPRWAIAAITFLLLLAILLPSLVAASSAMQDYNDLKALGLSGLNHLLAAKDDLTGLLPDASGLQSLLGSSDDVDAPYEYLIQRQGGVASTAKVTIHPTANLPGGTKAVSGSASLGTDTLFFAGTGAASAVITPTPTPKATATATPTQTPTATATTTGNGLTPDPASLQAARAEFVAAQQDFQKLSARLAHPDWVLSLGGSLPGLNTKVAAVGALAGAGNDIAAMGIILSDAAIPILTNLKGKSFTGNDELLTQKDISSLQLALRAAQVLFNDLQDKLAGVNVADLPLNADQKALFTDAMAQLPKYHDIFGQASDYLTALGWLLGTDKPRDFLVQTLDKAEVRGTGGFEGHFGVVTVDHGKIAPFSILDVNNIDYVPRGDYNGISNGWVYGRRPPSQYSWWPVANWGLRDANLNSDFPTSAKLIENAYKCETAPTASLCNGGTSVDGVIQFTPTAIASMLTVTGPLAIPEYNEVVTAQNLEDRIHYYQEDPAGIAKTGKILGDSSAPITNRSYFLRLVEQTLESQLRHLKSSQIVPLFKALLADIRSKDIQLYFNNTDVEKLLQQFNADSSVSTPAGVDGLYVSQMNVSVSKGSQYVQTSINDNVTLDSKGNATHTLTVAIKNNTPAGLTWTENAGSLTYRDYLRLYVPAGATLKSADGFDTQQVMCKGSACGANPYPQGERVCPTASAYLPTAWAGTNYTKAPVGSKPGELDYLAGPTNTKSDVPGRTMWGGWVVIPPTCTANITLTYTVPNVVHASTGATATAMPTAAAKTGALEQQLPIARVREGVLAA